MKELVELIAKSLVDNPDRVQVFQIDGEQSSIIELKVAPEDMGKVIGKEGKIISAIRRILKVKAIKLGVHFQFTLLESSPVLS